MKYCVNYYKDFRYNDIIDEIVISYATYRDSLVDRLQEQNWKEEQRIIIDLQLGGDINSIPILKMCMKIHSNFAVRLDIIQEDLIPELKDAGIPFFFTNYTDTPDEIYGMIHRGVCDVYVTESLGFSLEKISPYCKEKGVNVRIIPNIAQYKRHFRKDIPDPYKFFVRPEDVKLYDKYADVFEIIAEDSRLSIIYEIYRNEHWDGDLKQLIAGFDESFYNKGIVDYFGKERLICNQRCMQEKCTLCKQIKDLADRFKDNKLEIKTPKNKEWKNETRSYQEAMRIVEDANSNDNAEISEE